VKQHVTADQAEPAREWLTEPTRAALRDRELADIESGDHPERYVGWYNFTAECVEQGLRALCGSAVQLKETNDPLLRR
jgi:hypothetical protein